MGLVRLKGRMAHWRKRELHLPVQTKPNPTFLREASTTKVHFAYLEQKAEVKVILTIRENQQRGKRVISSWYKSCILSIEGTAQRNTGYSYETVSPSQLKVILKHTKMHQWNTASPIFSFKEQTFSKRSIQTKWMAAKAQVTQVPKIRIPARCILESRAGSERHIKREEVFQQQFTRAIC